MLRLSRLFVFISLFFTKLFAIDVVVASQAINFNEIIDPQMVQKAEVANVKRHCVPVPYEDFVNKKLQATHYMRKAYVLCEKDVQEYKKEAVLFDFGAIEIEKEGEIIFENDEYIRIRKIDGDIEKIYKDGRLR